ncbi:MAG: tetratricopeptide repeat protein [Verrucomicrobiia bacterium]
MMRKHKLLNNGGKVHVSLVVNILVLMLIVLLFLSRDFRRFCLVFVVGEKPSERPTVEPAAQPILPKSPATPGTPTGGDKTNAVHRTLRDEATSRGLAVFNESWAQVGDSWYTHGRNIATSRDYYKQEKGVDYDLVERDVNEADRLDGSIFEGILYFHSKAERVGILPFAGWTAWSSPTGAIFTVKIQGRKDGWIAYADESGGGSAGSDKARLPGPNPEQRPPPTQPGVAVGPQTPKDFVKRGNVKYARRDLDGAIADYSKAIELDPNFAEAYNNRGQIEKQRGDQARADADFAQAAKLVGR